VTTTVTLNKPVPDFTLPATNNQSITLSQLRGKTIVLYFYPKDHTPGCTQEAKDFAEKYPEFIKENAVVLGISRDKIEKHEKFKCDYSFPFELLSDIDSQVCHLFNVIIPKNFMGKFINGIQRSTFIIDANGILRQEYRGIKVKGHVAMILDAIRKMN